MLHKIKIMGMDCFYVKGPETSERSFNSNYYTEAGIMEEIKPMGEQMRDRADELEKALDIRLWCWQCCGNPFTFEIAFDLTISANLDFRERDCQQDYAQMKLALMKGIKSLQDKLKEVEKYEHNRQSG